jgi:hypothetical protein
MCCQLLIVEFDGICSLGLYAVCRYICASGQLTSKILYLSCTGKKVRDQHGSRKCIESVNPRRSLSFLLVLLFICDYSPGTSCSYGVGWRKQSFSSFHSPLIVSRSPVIVYIVISSFDHELYERAQPAVLARPTAKATAKATWS